MNDYVGLPTVEQIDAGLRFIDHIAEDRHGSVYIHCKAGRSRSAFLAAAYLISKEQKNVNDVVDFLKIQRPQVWIGSKGVKSLEDHYEEVMKAQKK